MKKFSFLVAAAALSLTASAATRILYSQPFEAAANPEDAGWTCGGGELSLPADDYGKMLLFSLGQNNGRSASVTWGTEIYSDENGTPIIEDGTYDMSFEFSMPAFPNNQQNSAITVFTNYEPLVNQPYRSRWTPSAATRVNNYLLDLTQIAMAADGQCQFCVNGDSTDVVTLDVATFYGVELHVVIEDRAVEYVITNLNFGEELTSGTYKVPASYILYGKEIKDEEGNITGYEESEVEVSMYAEGMELMAARYQTQYQLDNVKITCQTEHDYAAAPIVALTRIGQTENGDLNLNMRAYNINFGEGETLYVTGTDGKEIKVEYEDSDFGKYVYETTTSGILKAWTVSGEATSEVVETEVDCTPYALPEAEATIISVAEGYAKTYSLSVNNSTVPLLPVIFISWSYKDKDGNVTEGEGPVTNGTKVSFDKAGVLTLVSEAYGYASTTTYVANDQEFAVKYVVDFTRTGADKIKEYGFTEGEVLNSPKTSGEDNWTGRKRLYYYDVNSLHQNEEGEDVYDIVFPFGFVAEDDENAVIHRFYMEPVDGVVPNPSFVENVTFWDKLTIEWLLNIGVTNNATTNNFNNITIKNLDENDFVMVNTIADYGGDSNHPYCATTEEYIAQLEGTNTVISVASDKLPQISGGGKNADVTKYQDEENGTWNIVFPLYRIDRVVTKITAFASKNAGVSDVIAEPVQNTDPYYYSIDGMRMLEPTHTGIYIHQGKKVYIRK